ncbi:hypothetical protein sos41_14880 [Alphaproteobacteria bacterium SO-S41]|nr:hypothetical protein sos41_14880 [Alphaproteobacteria bacterium SO-S41]
MRLSPSVTIVSAGLDWEHKDLRSIYQLKKTTPFRYVVVLYDLIPLLLPHFVVPAYVDLLTAYFGELFWTADACIAISKTTEQDGQAYIALNQLQTPPRLSNFVLGSDLPVVVGGDSAEESLPPQLNGVQFALYVSTVEPRKNHRTLYHAWQVAIRNGWIDPKTQKLVFVGHSGWNVGDLLYELDANPALEGSIIRLQGVSDELLDRLYRDAAFCLMPSRYEGYGLPLAESLRYGKPCLSTSAGALCEVGGSLVTYLDPDDVFAWAESVSQWFKSPGLLSDMSTKIRASYNPTGWSASAEEFYRQVLEEPRK